MGKLLIILSSSPTQFQNTNTAFNLAETGVKLGHEVTIFCDIDAVYNLRANQILPDEETLASKVSQMIEKGARVLACMESVRRRGISRNELVHGVEESSLAKLVELMDESDRVVAFNS